MKKKIIRSGVLAVLALALMAGHSFPNWVGPKDIYSSLEKQVGHILEKESFSLVGGLRHRFVSHLVATAKDYEFDPLLILAIMKVESAFDPAALSFAGAYGLLQIKPIAAREVADTFGGKLALAKDLFNPFVNVKVGVQYLSFLRETVGTNPERMLAAYNLGPTHVKRHGYNLRYASKVLKAYKGYLGRI